MPSVEQILRALADTSRLRVMHLVSHAELSVGELAQTLGQSQPRVSQHVTKLCEAGLIERHREGSWTFLRTTARTTAPSYIVDAIAALLDAAEQEDASFSQQCIEDRRRLTGITDAREKEAEEYFARHAQEWDILREQHGPDQLSEDILLHTMASRPLGRLLDIGTGTGRIAQLLSSQASGIVALDKSLDMLRVARANLHALIPGTVTLEQGDFNALPFTQASFDTVVLHQVLHFARDPLGALTEAARVLRPNGQMIVVDLAAHSQEELRDMHQHARLGFADSAMETMLAKLNMAPEPVITVPGRKLEVKIWIARPNLVGTEPSKGLAQASR